VNTPQEHAPTENRQSRGISGTDIVVPVREVERIEEGPLGSGETHTSGPVTELLVGGPEAYMS
jgi:hypothetical protein